MENASKALLMAAGVLIGLLLFALAMTLFLSASDLNKQYEERKQSEAIQQFNANFVKYLEQDLTIHEVVTICNFASINGVSVSGGKTSGDIQGEVEDYDDGIKTYKLKINDFDDNGRVNSIKFE